MSYVGRQGRKLKILIVDDNLDSADAMGLVLEDMGHTSKVVRDGPAALAIAKEFDPDAALLDIGMPGMDGYEVARRLRVLIPRTTLIALSGWQRNPADEQVRSAGFNFYFTKPIDLEKLRELLADLAPLSS